MNLIITIEVDETVDPTLEDPHEIAAEVLDDVDDDGNRLTFPQLRPYAGNPVSFVGAEWEH